MKNLITILLLSFLTNGYGQKINPKDFGATGLGVFDDLPAIEIAIQYAKDMSYDVEFTSGVYQTSNSITGGEKWITPEHCYVPIEFERDAAFIDEEKYVVSQHRRSFSITANGSVAIYANHDNPAIYWALNGVRRNNLNHDQYRSRISGINIYAKGSFNGIHNDIVDSFKNDNSQVGILALFTEHLQIENLTVYGFKTGILLNNAYYHSLRNLRIKSCGIGIFPVRSHNSGAYNLSAYQCDEAYRINSNKLDWSVINTEHCKLSMRLLAGNNLFESVYFENNHNKGGAEQVIIGDGVTKITGLEFVDLTVANNHGNSIVIKDKVEKVEIRGGEVYPSNIIIENPALAEIIVSAFVGYSNNGGVYKRDADIVVRKGTFNSDVSVGGKLNSFDFTAANLIATKDFKATGNIALDGDIIQKTTGSDEVYGTKKFYGLAGSKDYIVILGKYSVPDGNKMVGKLITGGYSPYTGFGNFDIMFKNSDTSYADASMKGILIGRYIDAKLVKFNFGGINYLGIRFTTTANHNFQHYRFFFYGVMNTNNTSFTCVDATVVTNIQPYISPNIKQL